MLSVNQLKSSIQLHLDGSTAVVEDIGRQLLTYGRRIPTPELFARIDVVDASIVKRVANRFIFDQAATTDSVQLEAMVVIEMVVTEPTTHGRGEHVKTPP